MRTGWLAVILQALLLAAPARAHDALPIALTLDQTGAQDYSLRARFPPSLSQGLEPELGIAPNCTANRRYAGAIAIDCPDGRLPGAVTLDYRAMASKAPILLRLSLADGQRRSIVAPPGSIRIELPAHQSHAQVFASYFRTGIDHIATGFDHLAFLVCLMLIAGRPLRIAWTVTGFTLGHALTISLAALGLVSLAPLAVEVLIALSIVFVAAEIARGHPDSLTWRRPALVACLFGLLHGLGFAGALREVGLPYGEAPMALIAFNLGIEAGQLVFVAVVMGLGFALARIWREPPRPALAAWPIGTLASLWFFERLAAL